MTHLILHKVRGEPAFDIAEKMCKGAPCQPNCGRWDGEKCLAEDEWIIPTSGHRAYPIWNCKITDLGHYDFNQGYTALSVPAEWYPMPNDWPDHYQTSSEGPKVELNFGQILGGLTKFKFKRRM